MQTHTILDFSNLLTPINRKLPVGKNIRTHQELIHFYHQIKEHRTKARAIERQHLLVNNSSAKDNWKAVQQLCINVLANHSKDIEICTWLCEALLREHGFSGLSQGFSLLRLLTEKYWDKIFPLPDEDGMLTRLAPLIGLNGDEVEGTLITAIALTPLTEQGSEVFCLWHYQQALDLLTVVDPEKRAQRLASGSVSIDRLEKSFGECSADFLRNQSFVLKNCLTEYNSLIEWLSVHCKEDTPPSSRIISQLTACIECIQMVGGPQPQLFPSETNTETVTNISVSPTPLTSDTLDPGNTPAQGCTVHSQREQVLNTILQAAEYFRRTEPHSPLPYLLERAVHWGRLSFSELLEELIQDEGVRNQLCQLTGIGFINKYKE